MRSISFVAALGELADSSVPHASNRNRTRAKVQYQYMFKRTVVCTIHHARNRKLFVLSFVINAAATGDNFEYFWDLTTLSQCNICSNREIFTVPIRLCTTEETRKWELIECRIRNRRVYLRCYTSICMKRFISTNWLVRISVWFNAVSNAVY